jgi:hypothetical protein
MRLSAPAFDPLAAALAALSGPADATRREQLLQLRSRVQGPWVPWPDSAAAARLDAMGEAIDTADGRSLGRLHLDGDQILWRSADGRLWRATLGAPSAAPAASR